MSAIRITEKRRKTMVFALISVAWVVATLLVVHHLSPQPDSDTEGRRSRLAKNEEVLDLQEDLVNEQEKLSLEIRKTKFDIYQKYIVYELREKIKVLGERDPLNSAHRKRVAAVLHLLVDAREELVTKQRNTIYINDSVNNCREGNNIIKEK
jgi:hypothetical protein